MVALTLPGIESFLVGECKALGVPLGRVGDGWVEVASGDAAQQVRGAGTLRALIDLIWRGPAESPPDRLPPAQRLWFEAQWINRGRETAEVRAAVVRAAGGPVEADLDGPPDLVAILDRGGVLHIGRARVWGCERRRPYRVALMARALNPALARAMVMASRAREGDLLCDPCCGSGTVLAERAMLGPCRLVGVDVDAGALDAASRTLSGWVAQGRVVARLCHGDARNLPLEPGEATAVATNLPFGHRMGTAADNAALYPALLREAARILRPRSRLVVLTSDRRHLRGGLRACGAALRPRSEVRVWLGGLEPTLGVYDRTDEPLA